MLTSDMKTEEGEIESKRKPILNAFVGYRGKLYVSSTAGQRGKIRGIPQQVEYGDPLTK